MSKTFKVGERVRFVRPDSKKYGLEVKITKPLQLCSNPEDGSWFGYPTDYVDSDGWRLCPMPHHLRRKSDDDDGLRVSESNKLSSPKKVGQPSVKQPERVTS